VEFGVSRAYLTVDGAPRQLQKIDELRGNNMGRAAYVTLHEIPEGLSIVMTAEPGRTLADFSTATYGRQLLVAHRHSDLEGSDRTAPSSAKGIILVSRPADREREIAPTVTGA
jgi:hypothetical protein